MKLLEISRVAPAISATDAAELTHPLSFLDLFLFKVYSTGRLFFYSVPGLDRTRFIDSVVPKLKNSLALTLLHYLPLAGNILWPPSSAKPLLCYRLGDAVSLSISESGTFELTPANIEKLRNRVTITEHCVSGSPRLSTFVLSTAYVAVQELKAMALATPSGDGENRAVAILIPVDYRNRMETPVPANYLGNCVVSHILEVEDRDFKNADGFARLAVKMSGAVRELEKGVLRGAERRLENLLKTLSNNRVIGIAASNRFGVYRLDLGWGRPEKVVVESLYTAGHIAVVESRDGSGGVEITVVLTNLQMQHFQALFADGLNSP